MVRHPTLQPLSREHHLLLLQVRTLRWALAGRLSASTPHAAATELIGLWQAVALPHLDIEERVLLPFYRTHPDAEPQHLARVTQDHEWLRATADDLAQCLAIQAPITPLLADMATRLHDHIRFEERVLFQHLQALFSDEALDALAIQLGR